MNAIATCRIPSPARRTLRAVRALASVCDAAMRSRLHEWSVRALNLQPDAAIAAPPDSRVACRVDEVPDGGVAGADLPEPLGLPLVLRRNGGRFHAWLNVCPADGRRMDWTPGLFDVEKNELHCPVRGAVFDLDRGGLCVSGPCRGHSLISVPVRTENGRVLVG